MDRTQDSSVQTRRLPLTLHRVLFSVFVLLSGAGRTGAGADGENPNAMATLDDLVARYFHAASIEERSQVSRELEKSSGGSLNSVAAAVRRTQLWDARRGRDEFEVALAQGSARVFFEGPGGPGGSVVESLALCFAGKHDLANPRRVADRLAMGFGPDFYGVATRAVVVWPESDGPRDAASLAGDLRRVMRELRRRIRMDTDRVIACGFDGGGEMAWHAMVSNPDPFAGMVGVSTVPRVPYSRQLLPLLLPNLGERRGLSIWPAVAEPQADAVGFLLATRNELIVDWAKHAGLSIHGVAVSFRLDEEIGKFPRYDVTGDELRWLDKAVRPPPGRPIDFWFRYPVESDVGWLRATKTYGDVWTEDQLSIRPAAGVDRDAFVTEVLKEKLFHFAGRVEGQTVVIETHRIAEIELRLFEGMVDFSKPVTVTVNGRKRHNAIVAPSVPTLLESAYENWEFHRLVYATLSFTIAPDRP